MSVQTASEVIAHHLGLCMPVCKVRLQTDLFSMQTMVSSCVLKMVVLACGDGFLELMPSKSNTDASLGHTILLHRYLPLFVQLDSLQAIADTTLLSVSKQHSYNATDSPSTAQDPQHWCHCLVATASAALASVLQQIAPSQHPQVECCRVTVEKADA